MKATQFFVSTQKEAPADADVVSQQLMLRAGMIRKLAAGIYSYMPMGLRVIRRVEAIVREEMNRAGAIELLMPVVQPAELWAESGRYQAYGPELMRIRDRHDREFVIQPTSEEVVTDIARSEIRSYRQLPVNWYHIQTKFRDERRPRFGLMRGREFTMKDAYSFDRDVDGALRSYQSMYDAYVRIFTRLGLVFRAVAADTGAIGGDRSHEFQVIAETGEDAIVYQPDGSFAANIELAPAPALIESRAAPTAALALTPTPGKAKCEAVAELLGIPLERTVKSIVLATERVPESGKGEPARPAVVTIWLVLLRGDHELNEIKLGKLAGFTDGFRFATETEIVQAFGCRPGYLGPRDTRQPVRVIADLTVAQMSDFVSGANQADHHFTGLNWGRDLAEPEQVADLRNVVAGDRSPDGSGVLAIQRGIEVGHVFNLGTVYSEPLKATFLDETGKPRLLEMGCYGIGVTRILGAAIEQNHDDRGIVWPVTMAPFEAVVCPIGADRNPAVKEAAERLYRELGAAGIDVILDDRGERPGAMFADWELIGVPYRITVGDRGLKTGVVEFQHRRDAAATTLALDDAVATLSERVESERAAGLA
ncbi:proline--tRNA ligase [soil metagenome]